MNNCIMHTRVTSTCVIQDWTECQVALKYGVITVRYKVYRQGISLFQDIQGTDGVLIHSLELPQGVELGKSSYEVLLRRALADVVAA